MRWGSRTRRLARLGVVGEVEFAGLGSVGRVCSGGWIRRPGSAFPQAGAVRSMFRCNV